MASSADNFGMHLLSTLGLQFLVSASSYKKIGKDEYTMFSQIVNFWKESMTNYYTQSLRTWEFIKASMSRAAASVGFVETKASPALSPIIECRACRRLDGTWYSLYSLDDASSKVFFSCNPRLANRELLPLGWLVDKPSDELVAKDETVSNFINEKCLMVALMWLLCSVCVVCMLVWRVFHSGMHETKLWQRYGLRTRWRWRMSWSDVMGKIYVSRPSAVGDRRS